VSLQRQRPRPAGDQPHEKFRVHAGPEMHLKVHAHPDRSNRGKCGITPGIINLQPHRFEEPGSLNRAVGQCASSSASRRVIPVVAGALRNDVQIGTSREEGLQVERFRIDGIRRLPRTHGDHP